VALVSSLSILFLRFISIFNNQGLAVGAGWALPHGIPKGSIRAFIEDVGNWTK